MAELFSVAGSKIYIGGTVETQAADFVAGDFAGETWVEIDGWETMGQAGDTNEVISTPLINRGRVLKQKGTANAGSYECQFVELDGDAGQAAALAAQGSQSNYAFKVTYPSGVTEYFIALVMSFARTGGGANTVLMLNITLEINSNIVSA